MPSRPRDKADRRASDHTDQPVGSDAPTLPADSSMIADVESFIVRVPLGALIEDSFNRFEVWSLTGVRIRTNDGVTGTGFTSGLGWGDEAIKDIIDRYYVPVLLGADAFRHQYLWERMWWSKAHWVGRVGITQMALAACDIALWDIKAKALNRPLSALLGGHKDGKIPSYNTDGGWLHLPTNELVLRMSRLVADGFRGVKMKVGGPDVREDVRRVQAVREAIGPDADLMIDANQVYDLTTAIKVARAVEDLDIKWFEEPLHPDDVRSHAVLARATRIPLAVGEHLYSALAFRDFLEADALGYVQPDCTRLGGVTEWLDVAALARLMNVQVVPHHADMMRVHQHLGVAHPACPMIECIPWLQELFVEPVDIQDGVFYVPETPGASTDFDAAAFERYRVA